jgi:hypothetical protein
MLPYYAGVYAYDDLDLHPNFPKDDPQFMDVRSKIAVLSEFVGKAGEAPKVSKEKFDYKRPVHRGRSDPRDRDRLVDRARQRRAAVLHVPELPEGAQPEQPVPELEGEVPRRWQLSRRPPRAR